MHRFIRSALVGSLVATSLLGASLGTAAASSGSPVLGHVYVNNNTAGHNSLSGFDRHADGTLTFSLQHAGADWKIDALTWTGPAAKP